MGSKAWQSTFHHVEWEFIAGFNIISAPLFNKREVKPFAIWSLPVSNLVHSISLHKEQLAFIQRHHML
jgi:hypothetical protein